MLNKWLAIKQGMEEGPKACVSIARIVHGPPTPPRGTAGRFVRIYEFGDEAIHLKFICLRIVCTAGLVCAQETAIHCDRMRRLGGRRILAH